MKEGVHMNDEKRMAGDYEIIHAIHIGDKEVVFGENQRDEFDLKYMCGYHTSNELIGTYNGCMVSGDYLEIMKLFTVRVDMQIEQIRSEQEKVTVSMELVRPDECYPNDYEKSIEDKIVAIRSDVLRREYQTGDRQIYLVTGGFGARGNSRGNAVFATNLYSGKQTRWERRDIQGEIKPECLPGWVKERLAVLQEEKTKIEKPKEMERS